MIDVIVWLAVTVTKIGVMNLINIIAWVALGLAGLLTIVDIVSRTNRFPWIIWPVWSVGAFLTAVESFGVGWSLLGTAVVVAVAAAGFYGYRAVREGLRLPNRSDEYSKTINEAQQGATSSHELRDVYLPDDDVPPGRHSASGGWIAPREGGYTGDSATEPGPSPVGPAVYRDNDDTRPSIRPV